MIAGGGPIGLLVGLVAQSRGARVVVSELNPFRVQLAREFGLDAISPLDVDLEQKVMDETGATGADVVFEVSGSATGAEMVTKLPRTRGRIVVVAIFSQTAKIDLFRFFWRELQLRGARVYEPEDFETAIALAASGTLPLDRIVTSVQPLETLSDAMHQLEQGGPVMKILVRCSEDYSFRNKEPRLLIKNARTRNAQEQPQFELAISGLIAFGLVKEPVRRSTTFASRMHSSPCFDTHSLHVAWGGDYTGDRMFVSTSANRRGAHLGISLPKTEPISGLRLDYRPPRSAHSEVTTVHSLTGLVGRQFLVSS